MSDNLDAFQEIRVHLNKMETILKVGLKEIGLTESDLIFDKNIFEIPSVGIKLILSDGRVQNIGYHWIVQQDYQIIDNNQKIEDVHENVGYSESLEDYFNIAKWILFKVVEINLNSSFSTLILDNNDNLNSIHKVV